MVYFVAEIGLLYLTAYTCDNLEKFTSNPLSELSPLPHIFCTKKSTGNKLPAPNIITSKVQQTNPVMFKRCGLIKS